MFLSLFDTKSRTDVHNVKTTDVDGIKDVVQYDRKINDTIVSYSLYYGSHVCIRINNLPYTCKIIECENDDIFSVYDLNNKQTAIILYDRRKKVIECDLSTDKDLGYDVNTYIINDMVKNLINTKRLTLIKN